MRGVTRSWNPLAASPATVNICAIPPDGCRHCSGFLRAESGAVRSALSPVFIRKRLLAVLSPGTSPGAVRLGLVGVRAQRVRVPHAVVRPTPQQGHLSSERGLGLHRLFVDSRQPIRRKVAAHCGATRLVGVHDRRARSGSVGPGRRDTSPGAKPPRRRATSRRPSAIGVTAGRGRRLAAVAGTAGPRSRARRTTGSNTGPSASTLRGSSRPAAGSTTRSNSSPHCATSSPSTRPSSPTSSARSTPRARATKPGSRWVG